MTESLAEIVRLENGDVRVALPPRQLPAELRQIGWLLLAMSTLLLVGGAWIGAHSSSWMSASSQAVLAVPGVMAAVLLLASRTTILLHNGSMTVRDGLFGIGLRRRYDLAALSQLGTEDLTLPGVGRFYRRSDAPVTVGILAAGVTGRGRRVLTFGYEPRALGPLAAELAKRGVTTRPARGN